MIPVRDVGDDDRGLVRPDADLASRMLRVRTAVDHALDIVGITGAPPPRSRGRVATRESRRFRVRQVEHVEAAPTGLATAGAPDQIGEARLLVDRDVVHRTHTPVPPVRPELGEPVEITESREVEDLDAVSRRRVRHDVRVIRVDLHVAPEARSGRGREEGERPRSPRIGKVDDREAVRAPDERVFRSRHRICPAPDIVQVAGGPAGPESLRGDVSQKVHALAGVVVGPAIDAPDRARGLANGDGNGLRSLLRRLR